MLDTIIKTSKMSVTYAKLINGTPLIDDTVISDLTKQIDELKKQLKYVTEKVVQHTQTIDSLIKSNEDKEKHIKKLEVSKQSEIKETLRCFIWSNPRKAFSMNNLPEWCTCPDNMLSSVYDWVFDYLFDIGFDVNIVKKAIKMGFNSSKYVETYKLQNNVNHPLYNLIFIGGVKYLDLRNNRFMEPGRISINTRTTLGCMERIPSYISAYTTGRESEETLLILERIKILIRTGLNPNTTFLWSWSSRDGKSINEYINNYYKNPAFSQTLRQALDSLKDILKW